MEPTNKTDALISNPETVSDTEAAREKFEQARLSRRAALRKIGLTSGMTLFGLFAVDDLARIAIKQMEQHKETRQVAETVAKEFKNSGIAFAGSSGSSNYVYCGDSYCGCMATCDHLVDGRTPSQCADNCVNVNPTTPQGCSCT